MPVKTPWEQCPEVWSTEAKFWGWVRGVLRKGWSRHPVKIEYIKLHRKRITNPTEKSKKAHPTVWGMTCEICGVDTVQSNIEIDHIGESGKFTCLDDMKAYAEHLFMVSFESLRALCKPCHKIVSHSQKSGSTFEEAKIAKKVIEYMRLPKQELLAYLQEKKYNDVSNADKRKAALIEIFSKGASNG